MLCSSRSTATASTWPRSASTSSRWCCTAGSSRAPAPRHPSLRRCSPVGTVRSRRSRARGGRHVVGLRADGDAGHPAAASARGPRRPQGAARSPAERMGRMGVSLVVLGAGLQFVSIVLRGIAAQRWPLGNMYEFISRHHLRRRRHLAGGAEARHRPAPARRVRAVPGGDAAVPRRHGALHAGRAGDARAAVVLARRARHHGQHRVGPVLRAGHREHRCSCCGSSDRLPAALAAKVPSAEALDRLAYRVTIVAFPLYTFAVIAGAIWAEAAWGRFWGWDPKETVAFVAWVIYAAYLHARATAGWRSGGAAWVNVAGPRGGGLQPVLHQPRGRGPPLVRGGELRGRTRPRLDHRVVTPLPSASEEGLGGFVWGSAEWYDDGA